MPSPQLFTDLSPAAQTNFAELLEQAHAAELSRSIGDLPGSFNRKTVKGRLYWYWQLRDLQGSNRQVYLGPDDERLAKLIQTHAAGKSAPSTDLRPLAGACTSLGCMTLTAQHFAVINRMADQGFFRAGGILIGTHAFIAMANLLGVRWTSGWRTSDVDVAHAGKNVSLALAPNAKADIHDALTSLELGLLPQRSLADGPAATYLTANKEIRIDLLTAAGRTDRPYLFEPLNVMLQPLKFMEFSLEHSTRTVVLANEDAVLVSVPSPMRYAMHKLVIMGEREEAFRTKIAKDAGQVAALTEFGLLRAPASLKAAAKDLMGRGPDWRRRAREGLQHVATWHPGIAGQLGELLEKATPRGEDSSPQASDG